jgi:hypothetical protein
VASDATELQRDCGILAATRLDFPAQLLISAQTSANTQCKERVMKSSLSILAAAAFLALPASASTIVVNGGFEDPALATNTWAVFSNITGWSTTSGAGIEVENGTAGAGLILAHSGQNKVELDSHNNSAMKQDVVLAAGNYLLSFFYSPRTADVGDNTINYSVGDLVSSSVVGPVGLTSVGVWTEIKALFTVKTGGTFALTFAADGVNNSLGGFIDDVSITPSPVPLPAAGLLLLGGLGGLAAAKRRRKA